jgi:hypothetical protein
MLFTTTSSLEGWIIDEYLGTVPVQCRRPHPELPRNLADAPALALTAAHRGR